MLVESRVCVLGIEAFLNAPVKVRISKIGGEEEIRGTLLLFQPPLSIQLGLQPAAGTYETVMTMPFIGVSQGIVRIEQNGTTVYANTNVPVPYKEIPPSGDAAALMDELRRQAFPSLVI